MTTPRGDWVVIRASATSDRFYPLSVVVRNVRDADAPPHIWAVPWPNVQAYRYDFSGAEMDDDARALISGAA